MAHNPSRSMIDQQHPWHRYGVSSSEPFGRHWRKLDLSMFNPKIDLIPIPGYWQGIRLDDLIVLFYSIFFFFQNKRTIYPKMINLNMQGIFRDRKTIQLEERQINRGVFFTFFRTVSNGQELPAAHVSVHRIPKNAQN